MTDFKIGDVVWVRAKVWDRSRHPNHLMLKVNNGEVIAGESDCKPYSEPDIKQAIREVLLSDEFMTKFAAAWMKTPIPIQEFAIGKPIKAQSLADRTLKAIWLGEGTEAPGDPA